MTHTSSSMPLPELMKLPAFRNLLAKIETNFYRNRPREAEEREADKSIRSFLEERTVQAWEILKQQREQGVPMEQAQEAITEIVYPPLESDES